MKQNAKRLSPSVQIGDKVFLLGWKHLFGSRTKPRKFAHVERIDGAYIYVRPTNWPVKYPPFELYPNELKVVARYRNSKYKVGDLVTVLKPERLNWGKATPRHEFRVVGIKGPFLVVRPLGMPFRQFDVFARDVTPSADFLRSIKKTSSRRGVCAHCRHCPR